MKRCVLNPYNEGIGYVVTEKDIFVHKTRFRFGIFWGYGISDIVIENQLNDVEQVITYYREGEPDEAIFLCSMQQYLDSKIKYVYKSKGVNDPQTIVKEKDMKRITKEEFERLINSIDKVT